MKENYSETSSERLRERLRQEQETFDQHKAHEQRWFSLRLRMGYAALIMLILFFAISAYIVLNSASFSGTVVAAAVAILTGDLLGLLGSIWKIVLNPNFMTKLAPITDFENKVGENDLSVSSIANKNDLTIISARWGANGMWNDVTDVLKAKVQSGKRNIRVTRDEFGNPAPYAEKILEVTYSYDGATYSKTVAENQMLVLPEH